jgi:hypothetical protein
MKEADIITVDDLPVHTAQGYLIAQSTPASEETTNAALFAPEHGDGRSEFKWLLLVNGDLALVVYPQGALYEKITDMLKREKSPLLGG